MTLLALDSEFCLCCDWLLIYYHYYSVSLRIPLCNALLCCNCQWTHYSHSGSLTDTYSVLLSPAATCSWPRAPLAHLQTHILYYSLLLRLVADPEPFWLTHRLMSNNLLYSHAATSSQHSHLGSHKGLFVLLHCDWQQHIATQAHIKTYCPLCCAWQQHIASHLGSHKCLLYSHVGTSSQHVATQAHIKTYCPPPLLCLTTTYSHSDSHQGLLSSSAVPDNNI